DYSNGMLLLPLHEAFFCVEANLTRSTFQVENVNIVLPMLC
ncbi:hypothetical protein EJB05_22702, partial [Eragrostis curvula]